MLIDLTSFEVKQTAYVTFSLLLEMGTDGFSTGALDGFSHLFFAPHLDAQEVKAMPLTEEHGVVSGYKSVLLPILPA